MPRSLKFSRFAALAVFLLTLAVYWTATAGGFLNWDDQKFLVENHGFRGLGWEQLRWVFGQTHSGHYHPLTWLSFMLDDALWQDAAFGWHLTSVLLHAGSAVLVFFLGLRLLKGNLWGAGVAALLFALHPLRVESVAWLSERRDVLSGFFYLATLCAYLRMVERPTLGRHAMGWILFLCALLSKAVAMTLPAALLLLDVYPLGRLNTDPRKWWGTAKARTVLKEKVPYVLLSVGAAVMALIAQRASVDMMGLQDFSLVDRLAQSLFAPAFYIFKTLWPTQLLPLYEIPEPFNPWAGRFVMGGCVSLGISALVTIQRRRYPALAAAWIFMLLTLAPMLGIVQFGLQIAADRYTYLACLPWALLAGALVHSARGRVVAALVLVGLSFQTRRQVAHWHDSLSLWGYTVSVAPQHYVGHYNLATLFDDAGRLDEAAQHYRSALNVRPNGTMALVQMGYIHQRRGALAEAEALYRQALALSPDFPQAHYRLGRLLLSTGQNAQARAHLKRAMTQAPRFLMRPEAARTLTSDEEAALRVLYRRAAENQKLRGPLADALQRAGRYEEAAKQYRLLLRVRSDDPRVRVALAAVLLRRGKLKQAESELREALRRTPGDAQAHFNLGNVLAVAGNARAAAEQYEKALAAAPGFKPAQINLQKLRLYLERKKN
jgi:tetratricopeptide (TPR) repeat protein